MAKQIGIWMDKRTAKVVTIDNNSENLVNISSGVEEFHPSGGSGTKMKGGPQDVVQDSRYLEKEKHQMKTYFNEVISKLAGAESIVVFGPAETGHRFVDELKSHHNALGNVLAGVEKADSMTDNQVVAWVRDYFKKL